MREWLSSIEVKSSRRRQNTRGLRLEPLESRTLLAADLLQADVVRIDFDTLQPSQLPPGAVYVQGTDQADRIRVFVRAERLIMQPPAHKSDRSRTELHGNG